LRKKEERKPNKKPPQKKKEKKNGHCKAILVDIRDNCGEGKEEKGGKEGAIDYIINSHPRPLGSCEKKGRGGNTIFRN